MRYLFACMFVGNSGNRHDPNERSSWPKSLVSPFKPNCVPVNRKYGLFFPYSLRSKSFRSILRSLCSKKIVTSFHKLSLTYFFFAGTEYRSKGPIDTLHLLSFVETRLLNVLFWERKTGFGIAMKKLCGMQDSREKGMRDQDPSPPPPPFPGPLRHPCFLSHCQGSCQQA